VVRVLRRERGVCAVLAWSAPLWIWTLYTGVVAYLLMGLLFAAEWLLRPVGRSA
jgi:uncharacterized membrane protein